jgi:hypothetical protein
MRSGFYFLHLEHRQKLVLSEFEESVTLSFIEFLEVENVLVECRCLIHVIHLDNDVVAAIDDAQMLFYLELFFGRFFAWCWRIL